MLEVTGGGHQFRPVGRQSLHLAGLCCVKGPQPLGLGLQHEPIMDACSPAPLLPPRGLVSPEPTGQAHWSIPPERALLDSALGSFTLQIHVTIVTNGIR